MLGISGNAATAATIKLNKTKVTIYQSDSIKLKATVTGKNKNVTWKSSDKNIASVDSKGKITAKKPGSTTISAKANGVEATCKVTVKKANFTKTYERDLDGDGKKEKIQVSKDAGTMINIDNKLQLTEKKGLRFVLSIIIKRINIEVDMADNAQAIGHNAEFIGIEKCPSI